MAGDGAVVWFTGLPASGKTTLARALAAALRRKLKLAIVLDGDVLRTTVCADLGFSPEDRDENIRRVSAIASYLAHVEGAVVCCAFVSPYQAARDHARKLAPAFLEVHVDCPVETCEERDATDPSRKGLYALARAGKLTGFTGVDAPYEVPAKPDVHLLTDERSVSQCVDVLLDALGIVQAASSSESSSGS